MSQPHLIPILNSTLGKQTSLACIIWATFGFSCVFFFSWTEIAFSYSSQVCSALYLLLVPRDLSLRWAFLPVYKRNSVGLCAKALTAILLHDMESWNYVSEGKGFVSDETILPTNSLMKSRNALLGWQLRTCSLPVSDQQAVENEGFGELGFLEMFGKQVAENSIGEVLSSQTSCERVGNPTMARENAFSAEDDSTSKLSSSAVDSSSRDSSFIDLKLGRLPDQVDTHSSKFPKGVPIFSSSESPTPAKRMRASGLYSQPAFCQVYGCNKDLNSSKDYHKRHKVCEVHSKTARVIVNGIEQRFCQQCSRFHLLAEFDDGKRSCRKRLAGHNERRRKPQVGIHSGRAGRFLQSYNGNRYEESSLSMTSFICQEILPNGLLHPGKYDASDWRQQIKVEDGTDYKPLSTIPVTTGNLHSKSFFPHDNRKMLPPFHDNGASTAPGSTFNQNIGQYRNDVGRTTSSPCSLLQNIPLASEEYNVFDAASTVQGLSGISDSGCALSLLSSQSQKPSSHSSGTHMTHPSIMPVPYPSYTMNRVPEKFREIASEASLIGVPNKFPSSEMNSAEENHLGPILLSDSGHAVNFEVTARMFQGQDFVNSTRQHSSQSGQTIDLLQLSSQLQRVEHQRQSMQMKQDNDTFCCLRIT